MSRVPVPSLELRSRLTLSVLVAVCASAMTSCGSLKGFDSKPGEAYCGAIGLSDFQEGFVEVGSLPTLALALTLDIDKLATEPGVLSSKDPNSICNTADTQQELFRNAPLRAIPVLQHDVLSALTFGEGHDHDFFAWVDSTCQGTMLAVVSLMKNNYVELRLFKPAPLPGPDATAAEKPGFALFHLNPKPLTKPDTEGGCGFPPPS
ncbi:MAG TPA: hypothetical protein VFK05_39500 [Polyangiaceae bacterium]|nr:hypothetical protein [Polyangiaceae bacterium]